MLHSAVFHLGLYCLPKTPLEAYIIVHKGLTEYISYVVILTLCILMDSSFWFGTINLR